MPKDPRQERIDRVVAAQKDCRLALETLPGRKILEYVVSYCDLYVYQAEENHSYKNGRREVAAHLCHLAAYYSGPKPEGGKDA